jgi:hypothetical protein
VRIIPTIYRDEMDRETITNQYTFTDRFRPLIIPTMNGGQPGVPKEAILPGCAIANAYNSSVINL